MILQTRSIMELDTTSERMGAGLASCYSHSVCLSLLSRPPNATLLRLLLT